MFQDNITEGGHSSEIMSTRSTTNTPTFLETCVLDDDHKALEEHLVNNPVHQSDLDKCLLRGLRIVQRKKSEFSHVAPALTVLLRSGAKWNSDFLLEEQKTPYHIICESPGDHHELLDVMIKSSQQNIIDTQDSSMSTAVIYAVQNANINCLKCLIANQANVNIEYYKYQHSILGVIPKIWSAIIEVVSNMQCDTYNKYSSVNEDIFDLLLDKSPIESYTPLITLAITSRNVYCIKKLIEKGARLDVKDDIGESYVWSRIAWMGNVELLKCMLYRDDIGKDITDEYGFSVLWHVVISGRSNVKAVRCLLDLGVVIPTYTPKEREVQCKQCKENTLIVDDIFWEDQIHKDPCVMAICNNKLEIVKLLDEHGSQSCKTFNALRRAVYHDSVDVTLYLLSNYKYPLNIEFCITSDPSRPMYTLLTERRRIPSCKSTAKITKLQLDHGADPAKQMCSGTSGNAIMSALGEGNLEDIAQYIRSGVDINFRSYDYIHGNVLPFESSILRGYHDVAEIFLNSGCSCGVFSFDNNHMFKNNLKPEMEKLIKEWKVQENNVIPLQQRCRCVILSHLSPRADLKIEKLPLPRLLIKFLSIPEIDAIVDAQKMYPIEI